LMTTYQQDRDGFVAVYIKTMTGPRALYIGMFIFVIFRIALSKRGRERHPWTYWSLLGVMSLRGASTALSRAFLTVHEISEHDVILDGLFMALITSDLIVAKMANREFHSLVGIMTTLVILPHLNFLILCFVVFYYITVFGDLMNHLNLPLFQMCSNVYCDGIYDLCHVGHKNVFRKALKFGNRLFVGVVGDTDANDYKRPPIMSAAEREAEVGSCKCVTKVIGNAPCFGLTQEFIKEHRIHLVCFGQEYLDRFPDPEDDPYYKVPRKMGIARPLARTPGLSTSDLIARIQSRGADEKKPLVEAASLKRASSEPVSEPPLKRRSSPEQDGDAAAVA